MAAILILVLSSFFIWLGNNTDEEKKAAVVKQNGEILYSTEMKEGVSEFYEIPDGNEKIVVEINFEKGVRILSSTCPNKDCVKTGWVKRTGVPIVCLPNGIEVVIESSTPDCDIVAG